MTNIQLQPEIWAKSSVSNNVEVSTHGGIRGFYYPYNGNHPKPVEQKSTTHGYVRVYFNGKNHIAHRLIATVFIPNPENKPYINHIDGNKKNNAIWNLEWCTTRENNIHSYKILDTDSQYPKRPVNVYRRAVIVYKAFSVRDAARFVGGASTNVSKVCKGERLSHMGYKFKYAKIATRKMVETISRAGRAFLKSVPVPAGSRVLNKRSL